MPISNLREIATNIEPGPEGWWNARSVAAVSYPEEGNSLCFQVEDSSFWFAHRNRCILEVMKLYPPPGAVFDVGGGNGHVARAIQDSGQEVVLVEPGLAGVRNAVQRGVHHVVRATLQDAGVLAETLPAVGLFDVVEHIRDDRAFLAGMHGLILRGGRLYVTVPAYRWLWSEEDVAAGHERRYTLPSLRRVLEQAGYEVEFATYFFGFLPLPIAVRRALPYRLGLAPQGISADAMRSQHEIGNGWAGRLLDVLTRRELSRMALRRPLRIGGSCLAVARKR